MEPPFRSGNVRARCPDCGAVATFEYRDPTHEFGFFVNGDDAFPTATGRQEAVWILLRCSGCHRGGLAKVYRVRSYDDGDLADFYPHAIERATLPPGVPEGVEREYRESRALRVARGVARRVGALAFLSREAARDEWLREGKSLRQGRRGRERRGDHRHTPQARARRRAGARERRAPRGLAGGHGRGVRGGARLRPADYRGPLRRPAHGRSAADREGAYSAAVGVDGVRSLDGMAEWLDKYVLNVPRPGKRWQTISAMHALRRDARGATFRNPETGNPEPKGPTPSWLGTVGYLILAEQIGTAVYNTTGRRMDPGLLRAWEHFGDPAVDMDQRKALRSLRNAFAHDFGLVSRGREDRHGN